jgi:hypothetical protein
MMIADTLVSDIHGRALLFNALQNSHVGTVRRSSADSLNVKMISE